MMHISLPFSVLAISAVRAAPLSPQAATVFSLEYGYSIPSWQTLADGVVDQHGANAYYHARKLAGPDDKTVVKPNTETLYSTLIYDLSADDLEITIPEIPDDQSKLFSFYDPFGVNYANIGTGGFFEPGKYLVRPPSCVAADVEPGLEILEGKARQGIVNAPSSYGVLLIRWLVNQTNIEQIHQWQNATGVKTLPSSKPHDTPLTTVLKQYDSDAKPATNVMNLLSYYLPDDRPSAKFRKAGINLETDTYSKPESVDLDAANTTALAAIAATAEAPKFVDKLNNGWTVSSPDFIGIYGTAYAYRSAVAIAGYLALRAPYAVYPTWNNESCSDCGPTLTVGPDEAILFTFSGRPSLKTAGFWGLTLYNNADYLIENSQDTWSLGDRSNLTFPNGDMVYEGGANYPNRDQDGLFQILIQAADVPPPANWTENWLPSPAGGGDVQPVLRFYNAKDSMFNGVYEYPTVERIATITD